MTKINLAENREYLKFDGCCLLKALRGREPRVAYVLAGEWDSIHWNVNLISSKIIEMRTISGFEQDR